MRFVFPFIFLTTLASASVIGIDYGTDWIKVSIVKPGVPLDIVLNRESKRKTNTIVTLRDQIRYFGSDSVAIATRYPTVSYPALKLVLGKSAHDPVAQDYKNTFFNGLVQDSKRGTCSFNIDQDTFPVEELVGMQLAHAKSQAEKHGGDAVYGAVISVPPYFNQFERQAILDGAELAGLRVLSLINDETAVALNYAMTRTFNETQYHIFYDMGAGSTVATLVEFSNEIIHEGKSNRTIAALQVKAIGYDSTLGGAAVDARLSKYLLGEFISKSAKQLSSDPSKNPRAIAKFLKEANRVKQILSANTETFASIENVMEDVDFKLLVTRKTLEDLCKDILERAQDPIKTLLKQSGLKMSDIQSLILVGGSVRIPAVQTQLRSLVGEYAFLKSLLPNSEKIAQNINGDEAAVLGAGFMAATISRQYRVREIKVRDVIYETVQVAYQTEGANSKLHAVPIFSELSPLGSKKNIIIRRTTDFDFNIQYATSKQTIMTVSVTGLTQTIESFKEKAQKAPTVKAMLELTDSGLVQVKEVTAIFDLDNAPASIKDSVFSFFGKKAEKEDIEENTTAGTAAEPAAATLVPGASSNNTNATAVADIKPKKETISLNFTITYETIKPMDETEKQFSKTRLAKMDEEDKVRRLRDEAHNALEAFVYKARDFLENKNVLAVSIEEQRKPLLEQIEKDSQWLSENGETATKEDFSARLDVLKSMHAPIDARKMEMERRPELIRIARKTLDEVRSWYTSAVQNMTLVIEENMKLNETDPEAEPLEVLYKSTELVHLNNTLSTTEEWIEKKIIEQEALAGHLEPIFTGDSLRPMMSDLMSQLNVLTRRRPQPIKKKVPKKTTTQAQTEITGSPVEPETMPSNEEDDGNKEDKKENVLVTEEKEPVTNEPVEDAQSLGTEGLKTDTSGEIRDEL